MPLPQTSPAVYLAVLQVEYLRSDTETYAIPLTCAVGEQVERLLEHAPQGAVARLRGDDDDSYRLLYDALYNPDFCTALLQVLDGGSNLDIREGVLAWSTAVT